MADIKVWGWQLIIISLVCALLITVTGVEVAKYSAAQKDTVACKLEKNADAKICQKLLLYGIEPELYLSSKTYRDAIDVKIIDLVERNGASVQSIAKFTMQQLKDNPKIRVAEEVLRKLEALSKEKEEN